MTSIIGLKRFPLLVIAIGLGLSAQIASASENILLTVDATHAPQKMLHAKLVIPVKPGPVTLYYPEWIPGEHGPDGPVAELTGLKFEAGGHPVPWQRDLLDVYAFHVNVPAGVTHLNASYDYIEPDGRSATDKLLVLEWNEVVLYPAGASKDLIYEPKLILPNGWHFGTSLPGAGHSGNEVTFRPIALDLLVDSPVIAGEYYRSIDLTPPGEPIHHEIDLAADSEAALNMSPEVRKQLTNLVTESGKLFGTRHYRDYHFLLALSDHVQHFGLEHHESNDSRLPERTLLEPNASLVVGALLPHEFVHSWNGKFRRPADLTTPNFDKPMEDDLLWGYEGLTEFLGPLLAARSGLFTPEQYREYLASAAGMLGPGRPGRTWRPLVDTAVTQAGGRGGAGGGWTDWRRSSDYYEEGDLMWLEVATLIARETNQQKSIDDFCHLFHGGPNNGPEVKTYTFDSLVQTLNQIAPYDWARFFHEHVDAVAPRMPDAGIRNAGWTVEFNDHPTHLFGRHNTPSALYSLGLQLRDDGTVSDSIVGSPAFKAGISSGMKVVGVNRRVYTRNVLEDAIKASKNSSAPIAILVINYDYYRTCNVNYHGEERYPHLVRDESKPDYLTDLAKPRAPKQ